MDDICVASESMATQGPASRPDCLTLLVVVPDDADPAPWCDLMATSAADDCSIVLACPQGRRLPDLAPRCELVFGSHGSSIFHLWAVAMQRASGSFVAVVDARCPPGPTWLDAAWQAIAQDIPAFFGPVVCPDVEPGRRLVEYALEYGQFARPVAPSLNEVPGNNFVFRRDLLDASAVRGQQFHKVFFVDDLRRRGLAPVYRDGMEVMYLKRFAPLHYIARRFAHGRTYAALRSSGRGLRYRLLRGFTSLALPLLRLFRAARSASGKPRLVAALRRHPIYAMASEVAWSLGECAGYLTAKSGDPAHLD